VYGPAPERWPIANRLWPLASRLRQAYGGQARFFPNRPSEIVIRNSPLASRL